MNAIRNYFTDAVQELHHVRWPTRQQAIRLSAIVIVFVAASTVVFGSVDYALAQAIKMLLSISLGY